VFPAEFPADLKLAIQQLQRFVTEERRKVGLPAIEATYAVAVNHLEYGVDEINQIAVIRARFQNGACTDTPIEKAPDSRSNGYGFEKLPKDHALLLPAAAIDQSAPAFP